MSLVPFSTAVTAATFTAVGAARSGLDKVVFHWSRPLTAPRSGIHVIPAAARRSPFFPTCKAINKENMFSINYFLNE